MPLWVRSTLSCRKAPQLMGLVHRLGRAGPATAVLLLMAPEESGSGSREGDGWLLFQEASLGCAAFSDLIFTPGTEALWTPPGSPLPNPLDKAAWGLDTAADNPGQGTALPKREPESHWGPRTPTAEYQVILSEGSPDWSHTPSAKRPRDPLACPSQQRPAQ